MVGLFNHREDPSAFAFASSDKRSMMFPLSPYVPCLAERVLKIDLIKGNWAFVCDVSLMEWKE